MENTTDMPDEGRYGTYIEMAKAIANLSYQGVYLAEINADRFIYTSDHPLLRCGFSEEEMRRTGMSYLIDLVPEPEKKLIANAGNSIIQGFHEMPTEFKRQLSVHLNFHILSGGQRPMVCHKLQMLDFDADGHPGLVLGMVSPSVHSDETRVMAGILGTDYLYSYTNEEQGWVPMVVAHLSADELTMLRLSMQGYSMDEIGALMFKSVDTIKFYRRQVFLKLNVKNIPEAIAYATHYCLI